MKFKNEEIVVLNGYPKKCKDGQIKIIALINVYTDEGVFSTTINTKLIKQNKGCIDNETNY